MCWQQKQNYIYWLMSCVQYLSGTGVNDMLTLYHLTQRPIIRVFLWGFFFFFFEADSEKKSKVLIPECRFYFSDWIICVVMVLFSSAVILIHASLRLRNMKNRLENKIEGVGLKKTPMGVILDLLDQQEEKMNKIQDFLESKLKE